MSGSPRLDLEPVDRSRFAGNPVDVAPSLLGLVLCRTDEAGVQRAGRIVEVEAYCGSDDPASHAFRGPTPRTKVMFGPPGHLYVYRSYGVHWCANIVCGPEGTAGATLVRALEPLAGVEAMWRDRPAARRFEDLASGPGKACAALGITGAEDGMDLGGAQAIEVSSVPGERPGPTVSCGPRVGVSAARTRPWRFWISGNPHVSKGGARAGGSPVGPRGAGGGS